MDITPATPMAKPPQGVIPNFSNPESHGYESVITGTICLSFMIPFVVVRIYANGFVTRHLGWDDYTCVLGAIGAIAFSATCISLPRFGFGTHQWDLTFGDLGLDGFKYLLIQQVLYGPSFFFIKLSILLLYLRIFSPQRCARNFIYAGMLVVFLCNLIVTILFPALCAPRKGENWVSSYMSDRCKNHTNDSFIASVVLNFATDVYILVIPLPIVWKLHLSTQKRIGLIFIFAVGILACGASLGAIIFRIKFGSNSDYTFYSLRNTYMSVIEMNVGIIASCSPACASLFRHKKFSSHGFSSLLRSMTKPSWRISKSRSPKATYDEAELFKAKDPHSIMVHSSFTVDESRRSAVESRPDRGWGYFELDEPIVNVHRKDEEAVGNFESRNG